jgi:hypothetical protein
MTQTEIFLPAFDASRIEAYFFHDFDAIKEIFKITNDNLGFDLNKLPKAFEEDDIIQVQYVLHTIRPLFNFIGLPAIEQEIDIFYIRSMKTASVESLKTDFDILWPKLKYAQKLIEKQHYLFEIKAKHIA